MLKLISMIFLVIYTTENVPTDVGTYQMEVSNEQNGITVYDTFNFTIVDDTSIIDGTLAIDAHDFYITEEESLDKDFIIEQSKVKVWDMETLDEFEIDEVEYYKVEDNKYEAVLKTNNGAEIKIEILKVTADEYQDLTGYTYYTDYNDVDVVPFSIYNYLSVILAIIVYLLIIPIGYFMYRTRVELDKNIKSYIKANKI